MQRTKSKNCDIVDNKLEDNSPSLRCVRRPKAEIFVEMFHTFEKQASDDITD